MQSFSPLPPGLRLGPAWDKNPARYSRETPWELEAGLLAATEQSILMTHTRKSRGELEDKQVNELMLD